jgi:hypothetical protein
MYYTEEIFIIGVATRGGLGYCLVLKVSLYFWLWEVFTFYYIIYVFSKQ